MDYSREILRPPQCASSQSHHHPSSSTPPLDDHWSPSHQLGDDGDASCFKEKLTDAEAEIRGLKTEVKKLKQCMNGLHVVGRELKKSKEENERLKTISSSTTNCSDGDLRTENNIEDDRRARNENAEHDVRRPSEDDDDAEVADDENDSSSEKNSSDEEEEGEEEEEEEEEEERSEDGDSSSEDDDKELGDDSDGLEDSLESVGDDLKDARARTRVKRNDKSKMSSASTANKHQNLSENVHLQEENKELKTSKEAETYHYVTSLEAQELQRKADSIAVNKGETIDGVQSKECCQALEKEIDDLKNTVKEVKGVTHKWDHFWKNKKSEHDTKLKAKDEIIARKDEELSRKDEVLLQKNDEIRVLGDQLELERHEHRTAISLLEHKVEIAHQERETILNDKDTMLILTKERVEKLEVTIDELRRELTNEAQKSDRAKKLARNLLKQKNEMEEEIKRLNGTLVEKCEEQSLLKSIDPKSTCYTEPHHSAVMESYHLRPPSPYSPPLSPTKMKMMKEEVLGSEFPAKQTTPKEAGKRQKTPAFERQTPPPSPPPQDEVRSWTKDELKEQVELFREQTEAYESDFRRERRDREAVAGQLDSVKKELEKTKSKLRVVKPPVHVHRVSDKHVQMKPVRKDPKLHQLPEYYRQQAAPPPQIPGFQNKRDHLIAHGSDRGNKSKQRDEKPRGYQQPRYFDEYKEYEPELFHDDQLEICRCPKHNCYVPVVPLNNLSKQNGAY